MDVSKQVTLLFNHEFTVGKREFKNIKVVPTEDIFVLGVKCNLTYRLVAKHFLIHSFIVGNTDLLYDTEYDIEYTPVDAREFNSRLIYRCGNYGVAKAGSTEIRISVEYLGTEFCMRTDSESDKAEPYQNYKIGDKWTFEAVVTGASSIPDDYKRPIVSRAHFDMTLDESEIYTYPRKSS